MPELGIKFGAAQLFDTRGAWQVAHRRDSHRIVGGVLGVDPLCLDQLILPVREPPVPTATRQAASDRVAPRRAVDKNAALP